MVLCVWIQISLLQERGTEKRARQDFHGTSGMPTFFFISGCLHVWHLRNNSLLQKFKRSQIVLEIQHPRACALCLQHLIHTNFSLYVLELVSLTSLPWSAHGSLQKHPTTALPALNAVGMEPGVSHVTSYVWFNSSMQVYTFLSVYSLALILVAFVWWVPILPTFEPAQEICLLFIEWMPGSQKKIALFSWESKKISLASVWLAFPLFRRRLRLIAM